MSKKISLIIPVFNEEGSIEEVYAQIKNRFLEIIWIDDGSTDTSGEVLKEITAKDKNSKLISFKKNRGKGEALAAGFAAATGQIVVTMDGDGQDGPENIPALLDKINEGFDMVVGWKKQRRDTAGKRLQSKMWNWAVGCKYGTKLHDMNSGLKVMRQEVAKSLNLRGGRYRLMTIAAAKLGFKVAEMPVTHHTRIHGKSKYGSRRLWSGIKDVLNPEL